MTLKAERPPAKPIDFDPPAPDTQIGCIVELWVTPTPTPEGGLKLTFQQRLADEHSKVDKPNLKYKPKNPDIFVLESGYTLFNFYLSGDSGYRFHDGGVALSSYVPKKHRKYYFGWNETLTDKHVAFGARYIKARKAHHHHCFFFLRDGRGHIFSGPIDPDVLNPGDHPGQVVISTWKLQLYRQKP